MVRNIQATDDTPMVYDNAFKTMTIRIPRFSLKVCKIRIKNLQISRKLQKGKPTDVIADELEEEPERIEHICRVAEQFAPEYDVEKIYAELHAMSAV